MTELEMQESEFHDGYCLSLSDGTSWWITGDKDSVQWVDKLAAITELEKCSFSGSPKLAFHKMGKTDDAMGKLVHEGWRSYEYPAMRVWCHGSAEDVICELKGGQGHETQYVSMWNSLQPIYQASISRGGLPFHAGLAELGGRGVLLAAPGNTGKSTCCCRLPDYWKPLCDDESLVVLTEQEEYRVHPFPTWSDYLWKRGENTWNIQYSVPLAGVFFIEQSETDQLVSMGAGEAAIRISESACHVCRKFWWKEDRESQRSFRRRLFDNACEIAKLVPVFRLRVSLQGRFWEKIEDALKQQPGSKL